MASFYNGLPIKLEKSPGDGNCLLHSLLNRANAAVKSEVLKLNHTAKALPKDGAALRKWLAARADPDSMIAATRDGGSPNITDQDTFRKYGPSNSDNQQIGSGYANRWAIETFVRYFAPGMAVISLRDSGHCECFTASNTVKCVALLRHQPGDFEHYDSYVWTPSESGLIETEGELFGLMRFVDEQEPARFDRLMAGYAAIGEVVFWSYPIVAPMRDAIPIMPYALDDKTPYNTVRWDKFATMNDIEAATYPRSLELDGGSPLWSVSWACAIMAHELSALVVNWRGRFCLARHDDGAFTRLERVLNNGRSCTVDATSDFARAFRNRLGEDWQQIFPAAVDPRFFEDSGYPASPESLKHLCHMMCIRAVLINADSGTWQILPDGFGNQDFMIDHAAVRQHRALAQKMIEGKTQRMPLITEEQERLLKATGTTNGFVALYYPPDRVEQGSHLLKRLRGDGVSSDQAKFEFYTRGCVRVLQPLPDRRQ